MNIIVSPSDIHGMVTVPPSKSYTHRAIILGSLATGTSQIHNLLLSEDTLLTIAACKQLGAKIKLTQDTAIIEGTGGKLHINPNKNTIFCGYSGTTIRLLTAVAALSNSEVIIDGEQRLRERPIGELVQALHSLGIDIEATQDTYPPVHIRGGILNGGHVSISAKSSSQFVSALLLIAPFAQTDLTIEAQELVSRPYVDITIELMKTFGINVQDQGTSFIINNGQYNATSYTIEGDFSSASYHIAAAAITGSSLTIHGIHPHSAQGDKYFLDIVQKMGCDITSTTSGIEVKGNKLQAIDVDMGNYPDIVPTLAVLCAHAQGTSHITNIGHLRIKETDRIEAVATELRKMNIHLETDENSMTITGGMLKGARVKTYNDHRIAMSFAVAGLVAEGETIIEHAEVVSKSYPDFFEDFKKIGAKTKTNL